MACYSEKERKNESLLGKCTTGKQLLVTQKVGVANPFPPCDSILGHLSAFVQAALFLPGC